MRVLLQLTYGYTTIELGLYTGILFGLRTYEPDINYHTYEVQLFVPFMYLAIVKKLEDN
jgi:hypothetical protein